MRDATFALAIDVGNSRVTAAVVHTTRDAYDAPALFSLSASENSAPSAAFVDKDGTLHFGDRAEQLGVTEPHRLAREFAHEIGADTPVVVAAHAVAAEDLFARLCVWIVAEVTAARGEAPELIAITHPASWGGHRLEQLRTALHRAGIVEPLLISESEAAAAQLEATRPVEAGSLLAVYDLGGTRFDARVLQRRSGGRYHLVGEQVSIEQLGGANFDDVLLRHVLDGVVFSDGAAQVDDDAVRAAAASVRGEIVKAKEILSSAGDATVHLPLPTGDASVRVTRSEFEAMIDKDLDRTVEALDLAIESAGAEGRLEAIVLAGGSSRIPLVAQRLSQRFDLPIIADADPQATAALGAARIARAQLHDEQTVPGTALANITGTEKAPAPRPEPTPERAGVLGFLRPIIGRRSRSTSPLLLAGAAVFIAISIVFSSTTAAGTRWPDYVQAAASTLLDLPLSAGPATPSPAPVPPSTSPGTVPAVDAQTSPSSRADSGSSPRQDRSPARKSNRPPAAAPNAPTAPSRGSGPRVEPSAPPTSSTPKPSAPGGSTTNPDPAPETPGDTPPATTPPGDSTPPADPAPADPAPSDPAPADPAPSDPPPADPAPADPAPPPPADPAPADPPSDPVPLSTPPADDPGPVPEPPAPEPTPGPAPEPA